MIPQDMAYYYLNSSNELVMKVQWQDPPATIVYIKPDGTAAAGGDFPLADDAVSFTLYPDGSLESYRNIGGDGSFVWLKFAQAAPGQGKVFGPNSEYSHGDLIYSEVQAPNLAHEVKTYQNGNLTSYGFSYGTREASSVVLTGSYDPNTGSSMVSLANLDHPTPITMTGQGFINSMNQLSAGLISDNGAVLIGNDGSTLVGLDGGSLIGNDGSTLNQLNVLSLIGNDGSTLIGKQGFTLISLNGGANSIVGPPYKLQGGSLIGNDGSTLTGSDGVNQAANALASFRGYSLLSETSFDDGVEAPIDTLTADTGTTGTLDIFGTFESGLETAGDRDWVKVELKAGETYAITVDGMDTGDGTLGNPNLRLFDSAGNLVSQDNDSGPGSNARLAFTPAADGTYYVEASANGDTGVGTYEIGVHRQVTAFIRDGAPITNITGMGFFGETSIATLGDGGFAVGFIGRIDGQHGFPHDQSYHVQIEVIDAAGNVVDLDSRENFSTLSPNRQNGSYYDNPPGGLQMTEDGDGNYSLVLMDSFPYDFSNPGPLYRATVAHGNDHGVTAPSPISPTSQPGYRTHMSFGADIATLANGKYMVSMGTEGIDGTEVTGTMVAVSVNGATPIIVDDNTGFNRNGQQTSISTFGDGAVIVWNDAGADPSGPKGAGVGVMGAVLDASGHIKHIFDVNQTEERSQFLGSAQAVAELADGGFVIAWMGSEDDPNYALPYNDSFFRVFNADGTARGNEIVLGDNRGGEQARPAVLALPGGGFAIAWSDNGSIRLQQFDSMGVEIGPEIEVGSGGGHSMSLGADGTLAIAYAAGSELRVQIMEANTAPTDLTLSGNTIAESPDQSAQGVLIGSVAAVDENAADTFTYELVNDADGLFRLDGTELRWNGPTGPDYEARSSYQVELKATDSAANSRTKTFTIEVTDVNEAVLGLREPVSAKVLENAGPGLVLATLAGDDPDAGETFTYEIVNGEGLPFTIDGSDLKLAGAVDFESISQYDLTIRVTDSANHSVEDHFLVNVENVAGITFKGTAKADKKNGTDEEDSLSGAAKNDKLDGKGGNDVLDGGMGRDKLTGGDGNDTFVFSTKLNSKTNFDKIVGFTVEDDIFHLKASVFKGIGPEGLLSEDAFVINAQGKATSELSLVIFDNGSGKIYFDADGTGKKHDAILVAIVDKNLELTNLDFEVV
jgi:Ca2+-binding RTX toxin-like protein